MHRIGSSAWTYGQPLPRAMRGMASVSLDQEVIILGKNGDYIIIIHSIIGGLGANTSYESIIGRYGDGGLRSEILAFKGAEWSEIGQMGVGRYGAAATILMVNTTICDE